MNRLVRSNGVFYTNIPERVVLGPNINNKTLTPVNLIGQHHIAYGKAQNENYVWIVENFTSPTPPTQVLGQKWYKPTSAIAGEMLIAPADRVAEQDWLTVPVISLLQAEPPVADSYTGRMIIQNSDTLKMLVNNSWRTIPTIVSGEQYTERLLTIRYDTDIYPNDTGMIITVPNPDYNGTGEEAIGVNSMLHQGDQWCNIARFNEGGVVDTTLDLPNGLVISGTDALRFGGNYFWTAEVQARDANNPDVQKSWQLSGTFSIDSSSEQSASLPTDATRYIKPDPRIISGTLDSTVLFDIIKTVELQDIGTEDWDVRVQSETSFPLLSDITDPSSGEIDVERFVLGGDLYGLMFQGLTTQDTNLQWNIAFAVQGTPNISG